MPAQQTQCVTPKQGDWFHIYVVKCDGSTEAVFTAALQAEAYVREGKKAARSYARWSVVPYDTQPHDNNC